MGEEAQRQWSVCSMALNWCFNEPFPCAANNSVIGYDMDIKPAYHAICRALRNTFFSARISRFDHPVAGELAVELWFMTGEERCLDETVTLSVQKDNEVISALTVSSECLSVGSPCKIATAVLQLPDFAGWFTLQLSCLQHPEWNSEYTLLTI